MIYMIQMSMLFAGIATLFQTIGFGPVGARLPVVQGTSFAFLPVMIPAVAGAGVAGLPGLMTGVFIGYQAWSPRGDCRTDWRWQNYAS